MLSPILSDAEFDRIRTLLHWRAGIMTKSTKKVLVQNRLRPRLKALRLASYDDYLKRVETDPKELQAFLDALTTNETYFFREPPHWEYLVKVILPAAIRERAVSRRFSIWSAAASTGEELHTAAILLLENLPNPASWNLKLVGTDLNQEVLERARRGVYSSRVLRLTDRGIVAKYFTRGAGATGQEEWRLHESVKRLCRFAPHNLQDRPAFGAFDLVICRNVFIYFDQAAKETAVANLLAATAPGGHIFFSHTEAMVPRLPGMELVKPSIFRKAADA